MKALVVQLMSHNLAQLGLQLNHDFIFQNLPTIKSTILHSKDSDYNKNRQCCWLDKPLMPGSVVDKVGNEKADDLDREEHIPLHFQMRKDDSVQQHRGNE